TTESLRGDSDKCPRSSRYLNKQPTTCQILRLRSSRIRVIPLGVDAHFRPSSDSSTIEQVRRRYGIAGRFVLYVGNTMPHKNIPRMVQAFARVRQSDAGLCFVIAGRPDRYRTLTAYAIANNHMSHCVQFIDYVD